MRQTRIGKGSIKGGGGEERRVGEMSRRGERGRKSRWENNERI